VTPIRLTAVVKAGQHTAIGSTRRPDRVNDEIVSMTFPDSFPMLLNHDPAKMIAIGKNGRYEGDSFLFDFDPLPQGITPEGDTFRKLIDAGFPIGFSVAGIPSRVEYKDDGGMIIHDLQGMEISATPTPMHAETRLLKSIDPNGEFTMTDETEKPENLTKVGDAAPHIKKEIKLPTFGDYLAVHMERKSFDGVIRELDTDYRQKYPQAITKGIRLPLNLILKANSALSGGSHANIVDDTWLENAIRFTSNSIPNESTVGQLGLTFLQASEINAKVPVVTDRPLAQVKTLDADLVADDGAMTTADIAALKWGALSTVNHSMNFTTGNMGPEVLRRQMAAAIMDKLEAVVIGPASGSEPNGLLDDADTATTGTGTIADTETAWRAFRKEISSYLNIPANSSIIKFWVPQTIVDVLSITPRFTNAQMGIIQDLDGTPRLAGTRVIASQSAFDESTPATTPVLCGDFSALYVVAFNGGSADLVINPYGSSFASGGYQMRVLADMSIKLTDTAAIIQGVSDQS